MTPMLGMPNNFAEDSRNRDYDVFEQLPDGSATWQGCVIGMANVEATLQDLTRQSNGRFFALNLQDGKPLSALGRLGWFIR